MLHKVESQTVREPELVGTHLLGRSSLGDEVERERPVSSKSLICGTTWRRLLPKTEPSDGRNESKMWVSDFFGQKKNSCGDENKKKEIRKKKSLSDFEEAVV